MSFIGTVKPLLTHTPRWSPKCMGFPGLWGRRGMLKIDSKNHKKIIKNTEKINDAFKDRLRSNFKIC